MNSTPNSNRKHIGIFGETNSGKSSLMNLLTGSNVSLVSEIMGTTTDPVQKAYELIPYGPVLFIDTAGMEDSSSLGTIRVNRTKEVIKKIDLGIYVVDANEKYNGELCKLKYEFKKYNVPYIMVFNKVDEISSERVSNLREEYPKAILTSTVHNEGINELKNKIIEMLEKEEEELPLVGDLLPYGSKVILVVPIDSEAPKGRLILPQVQCIRDCLNYGIKSYVVRDTELEEALTEIKDANLVITDSQAFKKVSKIVPEKIKLTSFSMLFARQKGEINEFLKGVYKIDELQEGDKILIAESCSHNVSHEDIGRVKIPTMLNKHLGFELDIDFKTGCDFASDKEINNYKLIIHCGGCMLNRKNVINRIRLCKENGVAITNYGVVLSYLTDTLERSKRIFEK